MRFYPKLLTDYQRLWTSNAVSNLGDGVSFIALPLLAASLTNDPGLIAGLSIARMIPRLLFALVSGALVDRLDRQRLMYMGNFCRALAMGALGLATAVHIAGIVLLYIVFVALGSIETVADTAAFAILPAVVPRAKLDQANAQITSTQLVADEFVGPPVGGILFAAAAALPILLDATSFLFAAAVFLSLQGNFAGHIDTTQSRASMAHDILAGLHWLVRHRFLRTLSLMFILTNVAYNATFSIMVLYARKNLDLSGFGYGLLLSASALGGLVGSWAAARLRRTIGFRRTICGALLVGGAAYLVMASTHNPFIAGAALAAYIFYAVVWNVCEASATQRLIPDHLRGRVAGANGILGILGLMAGALLGGAIASKYGLAGPFWIAGALLLVTGAAFWPAMRSEPTDAAEPNQ